MNEGSFGDAYIPLDSRLPLHPVWKNLDLVLIEALSDIQGIYLVGGSVRDALLGRIVHDIDLVLPDKDTRRAARRIADAFDGDFYVLDDERNTARVILRRENQKLVLDFASLRGRDLEADLHERDFTINAMALNLTPPRQLIDPLGGAKDLKERILRLCSTTACQDDPLRVIRAIRLAIGFKLQMLPETSLAVRQAISLLDQVSVERKRDELFRILEGNQVSPAVRLLDTFGVLERLLPELGALKGVAQSTPHTMDVWEHTLATLRGLETLLHLLVGEYDEDNSANLWMGLVVTYLGHYRHHFQEHFRRSLNPNRTLKGLLMLAALYHDSAKPATRTVDPDGRTRFFDHVVKSAELVSERAAALALSQVEILRLYKIINHHMRIHFLAQEAGKPTRRTVHRFFREVREAGVDICLLSLADTLAVYGVTLSQDLWQKELEVSRELLENWWERQVEVVNPPRLLTGDQVMKEFHLLPGPLIGKLLMELAEAQASGEVSSREEALSLIKRELKTYGEK